MSKKAETTIWKNRFMSPEEIAQMEAVFNERFFEFLKKDENISIEGHISEEAMYITNILSNEEQTYYYPFETVISLKDNPDTEEEEAKLCLLDFIGEYFDEFFNNQRETFVPISWAPYSVKGKNLYARAQIINKKLEKEADLILKSAGLDDDTNNEEDL